ncbi:hypothetical protein NSZ01_37840 [Nocardioides szechwanensis]|uniref:Uncharacterized protein n=1 Tax=Nocardioides szechwanensis TaxID=1005944 RepID=A0A1H0LT80_9ACTN|nr:hypothetical protein [Nocardioides szechwanensis]GEP36016.1 hypothetical protein NSZ01_37840 [Nocardioides szechwanensis]SDO71315.1 hypothetical protein SAMN05192576_0311 [Nocardioides szechwanensis]
MSTQTPALSFTATVEVQYARELRLKGSLSDNEIRSDFVQSISDERVQVERAKAAMTRRNWERDAIETAVGGVVRALLAEGGELRYDDDVHEFAIDGGPIRDLEGVTITVSITDLVATSTLTVPVAGGRPRGPHIGMTDRFAA